MAEEPGIQLIFEDGCGDCGRHQVQLPQPLPEVGDDFDWDARDFDSFRHFLLQALIDAFPERRRWTPADLEVVLMENLAVVLDQLTDLLDRVASEAYLETARHPNSVRRLLALIGYDALDRARRLHELPFDQPPAPEDPRDERERFEQFWLDHPHRMEEARRQGPRSIHRQRRCVTLEDFRLRLQEHPLVQQAQAWERWEGAWHTVHVAVISWHRRGLDERGALPEEVWESVRYFHLEEEIPVPENDRNLTVRALLRDYLDARRMAGQPVRLEAAVEVGLWISVSIQVEENYFQSEVRHAVLEALGTGPGGFFEPGRLRFGEDVLAGDLFEVVMGLDGVRNVCLDRFKRLGERFPDRSDVGRIELEGLEVAVCDNDPARPERGRLTVRLRGGRVG